MDNFVQIQRSYQSRSRWEDIAKQIAAGNDGYLNVGDSISCKLKDGADIVIDVLALAGVIASYARTATANC